MYKNVITNYAEVTDNFKEVFDLSTEIFGEKSKKNVNDTYSFNFKGEKGNYKTIIIVIAVVGGLVVVGLIIYEYYSKNNENQRNIEFVPEQAEVEEIPDNEYNIRNGVAYENSNSNILYQDDNGYT